MKILSLLLRHDLRSVSLLCMLVCLFAREKIVLPSFLTFGGDFFILTFCIWLSFFHADLATALAIRFDRTSRVAMMCYMDHEMD